MVAEHDLEAGRGLTGEAGHLLESELARRWRVSRRTLQRWRREGLGPDYLRLGRRIVYPVDAILAHEQASRQSVVEAV